MSPDFDVEMIVMTNERAYASATDLLLQLFIVEKYFAYHRMLQKQSHEFDGGVAVIYRIEARDERSLPCQLVFSYRPDIHLDAFLMTFVFVIFNAARGTDITHTEFTIINGLPSVLDMENQRQHAWMGMLRLMAGIWPALKVAIYIVASAFGGLGKNVITAAVFRLEFEHACPLGLEKLDSLAIFFRNFCAWMMSISHDAESGLGYVNKLTSKDDVSKVGAEQGRVSSFGHGLSIADCWLENEPAT